jgi:hypothetical protein
VPHAGGVLTVTRGAVVAFIALVVSGLTAGSAAATAATCDPPGRDRSANIVSAVRADGTSEVTEVAPGGEYRVTRCGKDGGLVVSQTVSPILDPDGGTMLVPTERQTPGVSVAMLYGDPGDPGWAALRATSAG